MTVIRTHVCKLAITAFAFETQESLGLLVLRLTLLMAHWQPQQWELILSKMAHLHRERERWFHSSWQDCATTCLHRIQ